MTPWRAQRNSRGFLLIVGMFFITATLTVTGAGLARSMTELLATKRFVDGHQALQLAEAGIDHALGMLLANPGYVGETLPLAGGTVTIAVSAESNVFNPFSTRGIGANQRVGFAEEARFQVDATGTASSGGTKTIRAIIARAQESWRGAVAVDGKIHIEMNTESTSYPIYPTDYTYIIGNLRANWGATYSAGSGGSDPFHTVEVPPGANVTGNITVGPPADPDTTGPWLAYNSNPLLLWGSPAVQSTTPSLPPRDGLHGVWVGPLSTITPDGYPTEPTYDLPAATISGTISAVPSQQLIQVNSTELLSPTSVDDNGNSCIDPTSAVNFSTNSAIPGDTDPSASIVRLPGGRYCYRTYTVHSSDKVFYDGPTTIYVVGDPTLGASTQFIAFQEYSEVGMQNPTDPSQFVNGGVQFRSNAAHLIRAACLSHLYGSIIAPNTCISVRHASGYDVPGNATRYGSFLTQWVQIRPGANLEFLSDGGPAGPWVRLVFWQECAPGECL